MLVTATAKGYYGGKVREIGETFGLADKADLSELWMEPVEPGKKPTRAAPAKGGADTEVIPPADPAKASDPITGDEI